MSTPHRAEAFIQRLEDQQRARLRLVTNNTAAEPPQAAPAQLARPMRTGFGLALGMMAANFAAFFALVAVLILIANIMK